VKKLVNDLRQVDGFLRVLWFPSPIKTSVIDSCEPEGLLVMSVIAGCAPAGCEPKLLLYMSVIASCEPEGLLVISVIAGCAPAGCEP
jgi:hypothetical protein